MAKHWGNKYKDADDIPDDMIPEQWDFRNIGGYDYTGELRD